jgi:hypothetical protein
MQDEIELLDVSIILLLDQPPAELDRVLHLLETDVFSKILRRPVSYAQGLVIEAGVGPRASHQLESMKSQKSVTINPGRLEVHDRSGVLAPDQSDLAATTAEVVRILGITGSKSIGANYELLFSAPTGQTAARYIADTLFPSGLGMLPEGLKLVGGQARFVLERDVDTSHILAVEPRAMDPATTKVWVLCNTEFKGQNANAPETFATLLRYGHDLVNHVQKHLIGLLLDSVRQNLGTRSIAALEHAEDKHEDRDFELCEPRDRAMMASRGSDRLARMLIERSDVVEIDLPI